MCNTVTNKDLNKILKKKMRNKYKSEAFRLVLLSNVNAYIFCVSNLCEYAMMCNM